jgi:methionine synthase II (cobalamin-independent)
MQMEIEALKARFPTPYQWGMMNSFAAAQLLTGEYREQVEQLVNQVNDQVQRLEAHGCEGKKCLTCYLKGIR